MQQDVLERELEPVKVKRPRREMKLPTILSVGEVERLIMVTTNLKHRALLALAYSAGLRREEAQKIKPGHIDSERMRVHVEDGKGGTVLPHTFWKKVSVCPSSSSCWATSP